MRFKKELKDLKKGDKFICWYGGVSKCKVLNNCPEERKIYFRVYTFLWFGIDVVRGYSEYTFADFNLFNN